MAPVIRLLGRPEIISGDSDRTGLRGHQAWALLARILLSDRPLDRRVLAAELFPDAVDPLGSLRWCLAALRRAIGSSETLVGDPVRIDLPEGTVVDILTLRDGAITPPDRMGDLLEGIEPRCSSEFSTWLLVARERIAAMLSAQLRQETLRAISCGDFDRAIRLSEQAVRRDIFNEGAHILLVKSLTHAGSLEAAQRHVEATTRMFEEELGVAPSPALRGAARASVSSPPSDIAAGAVVRSLLESGKAALAAGAVEAGIDCLRRAVTEAEAGKDRWLQSKAMQELGVALVHSVRGYDDEGAILIRQSIESATDCSANDLIATGYRELGYVDALAGRRPEAANHLERADAVAQDADARAGILSVTGFNLVDWGRVKSGLDRFEASLEQARQAQNRRREIWSLGIGAWGQLAAGDLDTAQNWLGLCIDHVTELNWLGFRPWPLALQAELRLRLGARPDGIRDSLFETFALSCQISDPCWEAAAARAIALTYVEQGDLPLALEWLEQARRRCTRETDHYAGLLVNIYADQAELTLQSGRTEQANALARELLSLAAQTHMDGFIPKAAQIIKDTST